jgi:hypothetical protein
VYDYNLAKGKSCQCNACAKKSTHYWQKKYHSYESDLADEGHRTRLLNRLSSAIGRCGYKTDSHFAHYGGRGIRVCEEWQKDRGSFLRYVQSIPGWDDAKLDMDRKNNEKGYEPGNIQFVTRSANMLNRRKVTEMQNRIIDLEERLRSCRCGA